MTAMRPSCPAHSSLWPWKERTRQRRIVPSHTPAGILHHVHRAPTNRKNALRSKASLSRLRGRTRVCAGRVHNASNRTSSGGVSPFFVLTAERFTRSRVRDLPRVTPRNVLSVKRSWSQAIRPSNRSISSFIGRKIIPSGSNVPLVHVSSQPRYGPWSHSHLRRSTRASSSARVRCKPMMRL